MSNGLSITFKGAPLTVTGTVLKAGDALPAFGLIGTSLEPINNSNLQGKVAIISVIPSIDTPVCELQTKRFNEEMGKLGDKVVLLTVSRDLPFAQKRWCAATGASNLVMASDFKERTFGQSYGVELPDLGILARAVIVADAQGTIQHIEYVPEIAQEPNYEGVMKCVAGLLG